MKQILLLLTVIITFSTTSAQTPKKDLITLNDIGFNDDFEKNAFSKYQKDTTDVFDLLFIPFDNTAITNKTAALKKIDDCVNYLKEKTVNKTEAKTIKIVYQYVHKQFLKNYKAENSFTDIFERGEYNCLSASALYSIIFKKLLIPFEIRETPTHIYLIAYPKTSKILVETTDPQKGYYQFNMEFINKFVENLYKSKLIKKEEYESISATELFNKYYFSSTAISLAQLAGSQYSNYSLFHITKKNYIHSNEEIKKAYFLFPAEKHKYILMAVIFDLINSTGYEDTNNINNLVILCRYNNLNDQEVGDEMISNEFLRLEDAQLIKKSDYTTFDKSYYKIIATINDTTLKNKISFNYHYELARLGYNNNKNYDYEIGHLKAAYQIYPLHANLQSLVQGYFENLIRKLNSSQEVNQLADTFSKEFDFLKENSSFLYVKANCLLDYAYQNMFLKNIVKAENYLIEFESLLKKHNNIAAGANFVERAYSQVAIEYYKRGNYSKAKQLLKTGLIYAPNSFGLQQRLNQIP